jgi:hypothetical protein
MLSALYSPLQHEQAPGRLSRHSHYCGAGHPARVRLTVHPCSNTRGRHLRMPRRLPHALFTLLVNPLSFPLCSGLIFTELAPELAMCPLLSST